MPEQKRFEPLPQDAGMRLDRYLSERLPDQTRSYLQKLLDQQMVLLNGKPAQKKDKVKEGCVVELTLPDPAPLEILPENIPLDIVYEDADLLVVNKPKGMVVHPAAGNPDHTLVNALLYHCGSSLSGINGVLRPGIVHRIDKKHFRAADGREKRSGASGTGRTASGSFLFAGIPRSSVWQGKRMIPERCMHRSAAAPRIAKRCASQPSTHGMPLRIMKCWSVFVTFRILNFVWKRDEPIKFACTWRIWGIRLPGMTYMVRKRC